jgi:hypothetical protein
MPPSDAASVAEKSTDWIEHWTRAFEGNRPYIASFMLVAWLDGRLASQPIAGNDSGPDFSSVKASDTSRFLDHPFIVLPISRLYLAVFKKCREILSDANE